MESGGKDMAALNNLTLLNKLNKERVISMDNAALSSKHFNLALFNQPKFRKLQNSNNNDLELKYERKSQLINT